MLFWLFYINWGYLPFLAVLPLFLPLFWAPEALFFALFTRFHAHVLRLFRKNPPKTWPLPRVRFVHLRTKTKTSPFRTFPDPIPRPLLAPMIFRSHFFYNFLPPQDFIIFCFFMKTYSFFRILPRYLICTLSTINKNEKWGRNYGTRKNHPNL